MVAASRQLVELEAGLEFVCREKSPDTERKDSEVLVIWRSLSGRHLIRQSMAGWPVERVSRVF